MHKFIQAIVTALSLIGAPAFAHNGLHDPEIAHIAYTAGTIDIKVAQLAKDKAKNTKVRDFAAQMERDHQEVNKQALALVKELNVEPKDNTVSQSLNKDAEAELAKLSKLEGEAFDRAYIAHEVAYHKTVNGALETKLIPESKNGKLKELLQTGLKIFRGHQEHAEAVLKELK